jgi:hypothetical protein
VSAQPSLFDSCLTDYVQRCLQAGARIVKRDKGTVGMVLCPARNSEKDLRHGYEQGEFRGYQCGCGHRFSSDEAAMLTFQNAD